LPQSKGLGHENDETTPNALPRKQQGEGRTGWERPSLWVFNARKDSTSWLKDKGKRKGIPFRGKSLSKGSGE
jgi:hypothetical protein